jgi:SAM-dependent methyltransferase
MSNQIHEYYETSDEAGRLFQGEGQLELARTQELILRHIPPPPAVVLDIGSGSGVYACWLARLGYQVHLVDAVPRHIEQARQASGGQPDHPLASCAVGDARQLDFDTASADAVLLLGPLYHLTERDDRVAALREAHRLLRDGGTVFAAAISRFAPAVYGLFLGLLDDPEFHRIARQDLLDGQHRNPGKHPVCFTTAFFHHPRELEEEVKTAGFSGTSLFAIEGVGALLNNLEEYWADPDRRAQLLEVLSWLESEPSVLGITSHLLAVGRKELH